MLQLLESQAVGNEDPEARCNDAGRELEQEGVDTTGCPLQYLADRPRN